MYVYIYIAKQVKNFVKESSKICAAIFSKFSGFICQ